MRRNIRNFVKHCLREIHNHLGLLVNPAYVIHEFIWLLGRDALWLTSRWHGTSSGSQSDPTKTEMEQCFPATSSHPNITFCSTKPRLRQSEFQTWLSVKPMCGVMVGLHWYLRVYFHTLSPYFQIYRQYSKWAVKLMRIMIYSGLNDVEVALSWMSSTVVDM